MSKYKITLNGRVYEMEVEILRDDGELTAEKPEAAAASKEAGGVLAPAAESKAESPAAGKTVSSRNNGNAGSNSSAGTVLSPMPGTVIKVRHQAGEAVKKGQTILVLEAMKMENDIQADRDGILREMLVSEGQTVSGNEPLFVIGD